MKNIIVFEPEDFKDSQKRDVLEILSQVPFSLISKDKKIPPEYNVFPKLKIRSNKSYTHSGGTAIQGSCLIPLLESERFQVYAPEIYEEYHDRYMVRHKIDQPECRVEYYLGFENPGFSIRVKRGKMHRTIRFGLEIAPSKLVNALGEPLFNLRPKYRH
jgi:hypothetical protein